MFEPVIIPEARPIVWLKRIFVFVIVAFLTIGMISLHRALFQVRSLDLKAPQTLSAGSVVETDVVISGRTSVDVDVELIQAEHHERVLQLHVRGNELAFFDPRQKHASSSIALSSEILSKFQSGDARLRSVATGREQLTRLPPPTIRELDVKIENQ
jgi:hypothetical protein